MLERHGKPDHMSWSRWYFLGYSRDICLDTTYIFSIYGRKFVLWNRDRHWICYLFSQTEDFCFRSFPVVEKQGIIWLWYGKKELADENLITVMNSIDYDN